MSLADIPVKRNANTLYCLLQIVTIAYGWCYVQGSLDATTPHELVDVFDAKDVVNLDAQISAAASLANASAAAPAAIAPPTHASGVVWISVQCLNKGYPLTGATLHVATADDYAGFMAGRRTFEGEREVIGFVTCGQVIL